MTKRFDECVKMVDMADVMNSPAEMDARAWFAEQAVAHKLRWLLAFSDDGVNWGELRDDSTLAISRDVYSTISPPLRFQTLQAAHLFSERGELYVWRDDGEWRARLIADDADCDWLADEQILWGSVVEDVYDDFVLVREGAEGLRHAVPWSTDATPDLAEQRFCLQVRHFLAYDDDGQAYVACSRLVNLDIKKRREE